MYDPFSKESFEKLDIYANIAKKKSQNDCLFIIVENKNDITDKEKEVSFEEAKKYAESINASIFSVSAKTGNGIEEMFQKILEKNDSTSL